MTRERQVLASSETTNFGLRPTAQRLTLVPRPARGAGHVSFCAPWSGSEERPWFGAPFLRASHGFRYVFPFGDASMALVTCSRCGNSVSERAAACPRCGQDRSVPVAQISAAAESNAANSDTVSALRLWLIYHPIKATVALYFVVAIPTLLVTFVRQFDDLSRGLLTALALPAVTFGLGAAFWVGVPSKSSADKWRTLGLTCFAIVIVAAGIWLAVNFTLARYLLTAVVVVIGVYAGWRIWKGSSKNPTGNPSLSGWGAHLGTFLILAGATFHADRNRRPSPTVPPTPVITAPANDQSVRWQPYLGLGLIVLGIAMVKRCTRDAALDEVRRGMKLDDSTVSPLSLNPTGSNP